MSALLTKIRALPRVTLWASAFVLFLGLYFGAVEPAIALMNQWNEKADRIEAQQRATANAATALTNSAREFERQVVAIGKARPPSTSADPSTALDARLSAIVSKHEIADRRRNLRASAPLVLNGVRTIAGDPLPRIERLQIEWQIECDTSKLVAVLSDLESAPEVHSVYSMQVRKLTDSRAESEGLLNVTFVVETWYVPRSSPGAASTSPVRSSRQGGGA